MPLRRNVSQIPLRRILLSWSLAGCLLLILVCAHSTTAAAYAEGSFERTLQVTGPVDLDVSTGSGSIQIRTGGANQVQVTGHIKTRDWLGGNGEEKVPTTGVICNTATTSLIFKQPLVTEWLPKPFGMASMS